MENNEKIYVGRAKYVETKFGKFPRIWLTPEGVEAINRNVDSRGGINLEMHELRQPDKGGFTHYLIVDQWKPGQDGQNGRYRQDGQNGGHRYTQADRNPPSPVRDSISHEPLTFDDIPF